MRWKRARAILRPLVVFGMAEVAGWALLSALDRHGNLVVLAVAPMVVAGAFINRTWSLLLPFVVTSVGLLVGYANDPTCSGCGEDWQGDWVPVLVVSLVVLAALPALAMLAGLLIRRFVAHLRGHGGRPRSV